MIMMRSDDQHSNSYSAADLTDTILGAISAVLR